MELTTMRWQLLNVENKWTLKVQYNVE